MQEKRINIVDVIKTYKYHLFVIVNLLWIWALLSLNIYYFDDNYRAAGGYYSWGGDFRPFADWLYYIIGMGQRFTDLTPLPQIFALGFLYTTYFIYLKNFTHEKITLTNLLVFIPIIWSPFLLSNLYFRYDSIFMLLAVLLSVLAVFDVNHKKYIRATFFLFIALGFYQPAIVAYVCTTLFVIYKIEQESEKDIFKLWFKQSMIYFIVFSMALLLYYFLVMKLTTDYNFYSTTHSQMAIQNLIPNIIQTIKEISIIFRGDTGFIFLAVFFYLILLNLIFLIQKVSYFGLFIFIVIHISFVLSAAGINLLLDVPRFEYRTFIFYGFYISYLLFSASQIMAKDGYKKYLCIILFFVNFYFYSIALNALNAQKSQNKFEDLLFFDVVNELSLHKIKLDSKVTKDNKSIVFLGKPSSSDTDILIDKYPILEKLIINSSYGGHKMQKYYLFRLKVVSFHNDIEKENKFWLVHQKSFSLIEDKAFYKIYESPSMVAIYLKSLRDDGYER